jgi:hypothetical protein
MILDYFMDSEIQETEEERPKHISRNYPGIHVEGMRRTTNKTTGKPAEAAAESRIG